MNLLHTQQQILQAVLAERAATPASIAPAHSPGADGLAVYRHGYRSRLRDALIAEFPGLGLLMGRRFRPMLDSYIQAHPSGHYNIRWYGAGLAAFLQYGMPWRANPAWANMAAFDWAISTSFDAADEAALEPAALSDLTASAWAELRLQTQTHVQQVSSHYHLLAFRRAADMQQPRPRLLRRSRVGTVLVWRQAWQVHYRLLAEDERLVLNTLLDGASLASLCQHLAELHGPEQAPQRMLALLHQWLQDGLLRE